MNRMDVATFMHLECLLKMVADNRSIHYIYRGCKIFNGSNTGFWPKKLLNNNLLIVIKHNFSQNIDPDLRY